MSYPVTRWIDDVLGVQDGTPLDARNMNNLERGVFVANVTNAVLAQRERLLNDRLADTETTVVGTMLTGPEPVLVQVPAGRERNRTNYSVVARVVAATGGIAGDIIVSERTRDSFKVRYTGDAANVSVGLYLRGGLL